eukprot:2441063-Rhodomonas_salina.1
MRFLVFDFRVWAHTTAADPDWRSSLTSSAQSGGNSAQPHQIKTPQGWYGKQGLEEASWAGPERRG